MSKRIDHFLARAIWVIAVVCAGLVLVLNIIFHAEVRYHYLENVTISTHLFQSLGMLLLLLAVVFLFSRSRPCLEKINLGMVFCTLSFIYILIAAYMIANNNHVLRGDAGFVYDAALAASQGVYTAFDQGGYMYTYPHQLGLMLYDRLLMCIGKTPVVNFSVNLAMILGINFVCWQISRILYHEHVIELLTLLLCFAFIPQLFFVLFAYGQVPGLFFLMIAFYNVLRFCEKHSWKNGVAMLVCTSLSVIIRSNNMIGAIAISIYLVLRLIREKGWQKLLAACLVLVCMVVPGRMMSAAFEAHTGAELDSGCPTVLWLAMGTDIDNRSSGPGWFDMSSYNIYMDTGAQPEAAAAIGMEKLKNNAEKIRNDPSRALAFFTDKVISVWCEPLYQSLWSGPMELFGQATHTPLMLSLYGGGKAEDLAEGFSKMLSLLVWAGVCLSLFGSARKTRGWELMVLYFIGGFLFHLIWEAKSQYVYPYVFCLLPFAARGLWQIIDRKQEAAE